MNLDQGRFKDKCAGGNPQASSREEDAKGVTGSHRGSAARLSLWGVFALLFLPQVFLKRAHAQTAGSETQLGSARTLGGSSESLRRRATPMSTHAVEHYQLVWGIEALEVKAVESGQMIRFSYLVLDPMKAAQLNDKKAQPYLVDEEARVRLEVPTMEKVGQLRQSAPPVAGISYWMVFSNKGSLVKPGDRVNVVVGKFKAEGLFVH